MAIRILVLSILVLIYFLASIPFYSGDIKNHLAWAESLLKYGSWGFYFREFPGFAFPNYPPLAMFLFAISLALFEGLSNLTYFLNTNIPIFPSNFIYFFENENIKIAFLKFPALLALLLIAVLLNIILKRNDIKTYLLLFVSPAIIYLTSVWGQIDLMPVVFLIAGYYFGFKKKILISSLFIALAMLSKQTVIVYLPIYFLLILKVFNFRDVFKAAVIIFLSVYLAYIPFGGVSPLWTIDLYRLNFSLVAESVNENAINLWGILYNFRSHSDLEKFGFLTLQQWGYLMFGVYYLLLLTRLIFLKINIRQIVIVSMLLNLGYFFLLTRMHERYIVSAIIFLTALVFYNTRYIAGLILFTAISFLNLYRGLKQPDIYYLNILVDNNIFLSWLVVGFGMYLIAENIIFLRGKENE